MPANPRDSQIMLSSPEASDDEVVPNAALTPDIHQAPSVLTPPDSQQRAMPTAPTGSSIANINGKRPIQTISNGNDDMEELAAMANGKARQDQPVKTHQKSGYQWSRNEEEPGFAWTNKKAVDEYSRALEHVQHKDLYVGNRYGDPFETAEKEQALVASMAQR